MAGTTWRRLYELPSAGEVIVIEGGVVSAGGTGEPPDTRPMKPPGVSGPDPGGIGPKPFLPVNQTAPSGPVTIPVAAPPDWLPGTGISVAVPSRAKRPTEPWFRTYQSAPSAPAVMPLAVRSGV